MENNAGGKARGWLSTATTTGYTPPAIDLSHPQTARLYDYYLGGKNHHAVDQALAEKVMDAYPGVQRFARANRHFMHLAVRHLAAERGITQFLDIGTGIPTSPNLHEVAQWENANARILYTDHDPVVLAHARALMNSTERGRIDYIQADLRQPETIFAHPCLTGPDPVLDLTQPVSINLVAILHFLTDDDDPHGVVQALMDAVPSGSYLTLSHATADFNEKEINAAVALYHKNGLPVQVRSEWEIQQLVTGLTICDPGVLPVNQWFPGDTKAPRPIPLYSDEETSCFGLIAYKP